MILELDLGNTRAKWRIVKARAEVVAQGGADLTDWLDGEFPEAWHSGVKRARIASVLAQTTENELVEKIHSQFSFSVQLARSTSTCSGVTNVYRKPECLGVDRWLAVIAAYKICGSAAMVVDVGTALKVDAVNDAGRHLGGYIIPGPILMGRVLQQDTDRVRYDSGREIESTLLGHDTRTCVQHGIAAALVGAVLMALEQCKIAIGKQPAIYLTGGFGLLLKPHLENAGVHDIGFEADLVLDGLCWALP